jgi:hypothetical protein
LPQDFRRFLWGAIVRLGTLRVWQCERIISLDALAVLEPRFRITDDRGNDLGRVIRGLSCLKTATRKQVARQVVEGLPCHSKPLPPSFLGHADRDDQGKARGQLDRKLFSSGWLQRQTRHGPRGLWR